MQVHLPTGVVDTEARRIVGAGRKIALREKEARLLEVLAAVPGDVIERDELNAKVFDYGPAVSSRTLDTTIRRLRQKLDEVGAGEVIQTVYGRGYRFVPTSAPSDGRTTGYEAAARALREATGTPGVTVLTGPGGVGKTTLYREVLRDHADVVVVACTPDDAIGPRVLSAVGMDAAPADAVGAALTLRSGLCLVLDDAEALPAEELTTAVSWPAVAEGLHLLLVSRRRLPLPGAVEVAIDGLAADAARALFARAAQVDPAAVTDELMGLLGSHPLALLLAGHRVRALGLDAFALHLRSRPDQLTGAAPLPAKHRSLAEILRDTLALVHEDAVGALTRIAAADDPLDASALSAVVGDQGLDRVAELVDAHLVQRDGAQFVVHPRARAYLRAEGPATAWADGERRYLTHLADRVRAGLPHVHALPSLDVLRRAEPRARGSAHPRASELLLARCLRQRSETGDVRELGPIVAATPEDRFVALVAAHVDRAQHPGSLAVADRAVELCADHPALAIDAHLHRAQVRADHRDRDGANADLAIVDAHASTFGEPALLRAWLGGAVALRGVDPEGSAERARRVEPHLAQLSTASQLHWYGVAIPAAARVLDHARCHALADAAVALAEEVGAPEDLAAAYVQRAPARWFRGDVDGGRQDAERAVRLSAGGPRWQQFVACNNLAAFGLHTLDWESAHRALSTALLRAGGAEATRRGAELRLAGLERVLGRGPSGPDAIHGIRDDQWLLWPAQSGDVAGSVALADALIADGAPLTPGRAASLHAAAEIYLAAGRWADAIAAVRQALSASFSASPERPLLAAVEALALRASGRRAPPGSRAFGPSAFVRASAEAWWAAHDALAGDPVGGMDAIAAIEARVASPWLTERSVLAFRIRAARAIATRAG